MTGRFGWTQEPDGSYRAVMPDRVTLVASPDALTNFGTKPKRGTTWRAQASQWDGRHTIRGFGRDEYGTKHKTAKAAMRAAERIYLDATTESGATTSPLTDPQPQPDRTTP